MSGIYITGDINDYLATVYTSDNSYIKEIYIGEETTPSFSFGTKGLEYTAITNSDNEITGYSVAVGTAYNESEITIPTYYKGKYVTEIKANGFAGTSQVPNEKLTTINLLTDSQLIKINDNSFFHCTKLTTINNLPNTLTSIGNCAFGYCTALPSINLSNTSITTLNSQIFTYCQSLSSITLPTNLTIISNEAFRQCEVLTGVVLPSTLTSIGDNAFYNCSALESIILPDTVTTLGKQALYNCSSLTEITFDKNLTTIGEDACGECTALTTVNWNSTDCNYDYYSESSVQKTLFQTCTNLSTITIGDNVTKIYSGIFANNKAQIITVGKKVANMYGVTFHDCSNLKTLNWNATKCAVDDSETRFDNCNNFTTLNIGSNVTYIAKKLFKNCEYIKSANLSNVISLLDYAFYGCIRLSSITLSDNLTTINPYVFYGCSALSSTSILKSNLQYIKDYAFYGCSSLNCDFQNATSLTTISQYAFANCVSLTILKNLNNNLILNTHSFDGCTSLNTITFANDVEIKSYVFNNCTGITSITAYDADALTILNQSDATNVTITFIDSVTSIPALRFANQQGIQKVYFNNVISIGDGAFGYCYKLENIYLNNVQTIGDRAFTTCKTLSQLNLPESLQDINGESAIGYEAFMGCGIESVTYYQPSDEVTRYLTIDEDAFSYCSSLSTITLGNAYTNSNTIISIKDEAFYRCEKVWQIMFNSKAYYDSTTKTAYPWFGENAFRYVGYDIAEENRRLILKPIEDNWYCEDSTGTSTKISIGGIAVLPKEQSATRFTNLINNQGDNKYIYYKE